MKLTNFEVKTHKIANCREICSSGLIIIKILNEILTEEKISTFISNFDFSTFSSESIVLNMRDIIKNKLLDYITKVKVEHSALSGRNTITFKNKSGKKKI